MKKEVIDFLKQHGHKSTAELALLLSKQSHLPKNLIINQANGRQKAKQKFPFLVQYPEYIFPSATAVAQSSSEKTAKYKSSIMSAKKIADLSGGMGLDSVFFVQKADSCYYVEHNEELAQLTQQNFIKLGINNIEVKCEDAVRFLENAILFFDLIYIDPDRRANKERAFKIEDCQPNVAQLLTLIFQKSKACLIRILISTFLIDRALYS